MRIQNKQSFILLGAALFLVLMVIILVISSFFRSTSTNEVTTSVPTPTPVPYVRDKEGNFNYTPLQKTIINRTTTNEVEEQQEILNKSLRGTRIVYEVPSATAYESDEIQAVNGVVISERINLFNTQVGTPPKVGVYQQEFGQPEKILESVSRMGLHISAYIYAEDGFTLFVNPNTNTVYEIHRYIPMTTEEYEIDYADYLQPAPPYPQEFHGQ